MKVFISWSGPLSKRLGEAIRDWLPGVIQLVTPYFTPSDIEKGMRWSMDIAQELEDSQVGILCVTQDNLHSDWILFEAGALSKSLQKSHVCPILFGITNTDLSGPLKQFQTTTFEKSDFHKLIGVINSQLSDHKLPPKTLDAVFEKWWPDLESKIKEILLDVKELDQPIRNDRELLEEILVLSRAATTRGLRPSTTMAYRAIEDLLNHFINLHDGQASEDAGYQSTLDSLRKMSKPIYYIASKYQGRSDKLDDLILRFKELTFTTIDDSQNSSGEDEEIPF